MYSILRIFLGWGGGGDYDLGGMEKVKKDEKLGRVQMLYAARVSF